MGSFVRMWYCGRKTDRWIFNLANLIIQFFDQITKTPLMPEFQITQEYLGQVCIWSISHRWKEFFSYVSPNSMDAILRASLSAMIKTGADISFHTNYAFGRLAWNPSLVRRNCQRMVGNRPFRIIPILSTDVRYALAAESRVLTIWCLSVCITYLRPIIITGGSLIKSEFFRWNGAGILS